MADNDIRENGSARDSQGDELEGVLEDFDESFIDPDAVFDEEQDVLEARGMAGDSFWELRRGERFSDFSERVSPHLQRDAVFWWHVLRQSEGDWMAAYFLGPQLACLGAAYNTGLLSTISEEDFEEIAYLFPRESLEDNVAFYEQQSTDSQFYAKYSREMAHVFSYLAQDFADRGTEWALEVIYDEIRKNLVVVKLAAREAHRVFDEMSVEAGKEAPEGTEMVGVSDVDENWVPNAFVGLHGAAEARRQAAGLAEQVGQLACMVAGDDGDDHSMLPVPDDDVLSLLMLQCYIWTGRSWNKVPEKASDTIYGALCYVKSLFGSRPDFEDDDPEVRHARLDELAVRFDDGNGGYALEVDEDKPPIEGFDEEGNQTLQYALTPESNEFMQLMHQEEVLARLEMEEQVAVKYSQNMPSCRDNVHSLLAEDIISSLQEAVEAGAKFEDAFDELAERIDKRKNALFPKAKSAWKKYLKGNPEAAAAAKRGELVLGYDANGAPVFSGDYVPLIREQPESEHEGEGE